MYSRLYRTVCKSPSRRRRSAVRQPPATRGGPHHPGAHHRGGQGRRSCARGFGGTTIRQVAEDAGVSQETIYKTFGGKAALLKSVYDVSLAGDDEDIPLAERPEAIAVRDAAEPCRRGDGLCRAGTAPSRAGSTRCCGCSSGRATPTRLWPSSPRTTEKERHVGSRSTSGSGTRPRAGSATTSRLEHAIDTVWALNSPSPAGCCSITAGARSSTREWLAELIRNAIFIDREHD